MEMFLVLLQTSQTCLSAKLILVCYNETIQADCKESCGNIFFQHFHVSFLQNFRRSSRMPIINKFVQFIQKYITYDAASAVPFLQKHSDVLQ